MTPLLPRLQSELVGAARRRRRRSWARRPRLAVAFAALTLAGGTATVAAVSGVFGTVEEGTTPTASYSVSAYEDGSQLCLEIRWPRQPADAPLELRRAERAYRCDLPPAARRPFGPVMRDVSPDAVRLLFGIVSEDVRHVRVGGLSEPVATREQPGVPGRVFSARLRTSRIVLVAEDADGRALGRLGGEDLGHPPRSLDEARRSGDEAAFAPSVDAPSSFEYGGRAIDESEAAERGLACAQAADLVVCADSGREAERLLRERARRER